MNGILLAEPVEVMEVTLSAAVKVGTHVKARAKAQPPANLEKLGNCILAAAVAVVHQLAAVRADPAAAVRAALTAAAAQAERLIPAAALAAR